MVLRLMVILLLLCDLGLVVKDDVDECWFVCWLCRYLGCLDCSVKLGVLFVLNFLESDCDFESEGFWFVDFVVIELECDLGRVLLLFFLFLLMFVG